MGKNNIQAEVEKPNCFGLSTWCCCEKCTAYFEYLKSKQSISPLDENGSVIPDKIEKAAKVYAENYYNKALDGSDTLKEFYSGSGYLLNFSIEIVEKHFLAGASLNQQKAMELEEWREECERLAKVAEHWQKQYNELKGGFKRPKLDHL